MLTKDNVNICRIITSKEQWELEIIIKGENFEFRYMIIGGDETRFEEWMDFVDGKRQIMDFYQGNGEGSMTVNSHGMCIFSAMPSRGSGDVASTMAVPFDIMSSKLREAIENAQKNGLAFL
jgi:hypothetical protein